MTLSRPIPRALDTLLLMLFLALMFIWALPHLTALRNSLSFSTLLLSAYLLWFSHTPLRTALPRRIWVSYACLTAWIIIGTLLFSDNVRYNLQEIWGQWLRSGLTAAAGFCVATLAIRGALRWTSAKLLLALMLVLTLQVTLHDLDVLWRWWQSGRLPFGETRIVESRTVLTYVVNLLLAFVAAEVMCRALFQRRHMPIANSFLVFIVILCLFASYVLGTRNGMVGTLMLLCSCVFLFWFGKRKSVNNLLLASGVSILFALIVGYGWIAYKSDPRWTTFAATLPIAWDTQHHQAWLRSDVIPYPQAFPTLPNGAYVDGSNYGRIAWGKEALKQVLRTPLGIGYSRTSFGDALKQVYPNFATSLQSHCGILDFTIATGIPGLLLFLVLLVLCVQIGWTAFFRRGNPAGLLLLFVVTGFFGRSLLDSNIRDHMLEQFMFMACLLTVLAAREDRHDA